MCEDANTKGVDMRRVVDRGVTGMLGEALVWLRFKEFYKRTQSNPSPHLPALHPTLLLTILPSVKMMSSITTTCLARRLPTTRTVAVAALT